MGKVADILQARGELDEALRIRREEQLPVYEKGGRWFSASEAESAGRAVSCNLTQKTGPADIVTGAEVDRSRPGGCRACPAYCPADGPMRGGEIPGSWPDPVPILSRSRPVSRQLPEFGLVDLLRDHMYHITNVREDGTIPKFEAPSWKQLNTFRTNSQIEGGGLCKPPIPQ